MAYVELLPRLLGFALAVLTVLAALHCILYKRDPRSALAWIGLILLSPGLGAVCYFIFGVNRIRRAARALRKLPQENALLDGAQPQGRAEGVASNGMFLLGERASGRPLTSGNCVEPLVHGDQAYPRMLEAIASAERSVSLATYIFDSDEVGRRFISALSEAHRRGVEVRVLIDGVGALYKLPTAVRLLKYNSVRAASFLPLLGLRSFSFLNMRLHRKLLVIDGCLAFCGGMNIRAGHLLATKPSHPVRDLHFKIEGPVVSQLQRVFVRDWQFATQETLGGERWFPSIMPRGQILARAIPDGPDEDFERVRWMFLGALASAERSVRIMTPYFLPDSTLIAALNTAALRGVTVEVLLPGLNNLPWMTWATRAILWQLIEKGCNVYFSPPPFDHTKLMVVDGRRVQFGSTNWDARSLRLNFELDVECFDKELGIQLDELFSEAMRKARPVTLEELDGRSLPARVRDGIARLFSPVL